MDSSNRTKSCEKINLVRKECVEAALKELDLPAEVSAAEAARILGCSKRHVISYIEGGLLEWRDGSSPASSRSVYRIKLESVLEVRNNYRRTKTPELRHSGNRRTIPVSQPMAPNHIRLW